MEKCKQLPRRFVLCDPSDGVSGGLGQTPLPEHRYATPLRRGGYAAPDRGGYFAAEEIFERRASFSEANSGAESGLSFQSMNVCWRSMKNRRVSGFSAKV